MVDADFLVIGSGAAGLSFALKVAEYGSVVVVTKSAVTESNTRFAQGGISSVTDAGDSFEQHIADTMAAGAGINDPATVDLVVRRAPELIKDLVEWGTQFDKPTSWHARVATPSTAFFTTRTSPGPRSNVRWWSRCGVTKTSLFTKIILPSIYSPSTTWAR